MFPICSSTARRPTQAVGGTITVVPERAADAPLIRGIVSHVSHSVPRLRLLGGVSHFDPDRKKAADGATGDKQVAGVPHVQLNLDGERDVAGPPA